jgi:ornithine carbamoyltransferase
MATALFPDQITRISAPDLTRDLDLLDDEVARLLEFTHELKRAPGRFAQALAGKSVATLFEKPSLRTRLTFELAAQQLGASVVTGEGPIGGREPVKDVARNLDRWVNAIVARTFSQDTIEELARWSSVPVINALSDRFHPCQALADIFTLNERFGELRGLKLAFVGDGNNVSHSLMLTASRLGMHFSIATPRGYQPHPDVVACARNVAAVSGSRLEILNDPEQAVRGANAVYTDVWVSMGQEAEAEKRRRDFSPFQVNEKLFAQALPDAIFLHCLPAKRGEEVTDAVMEGPRSAVFDQAENRLHTQKALMMMIV